MSRFCCSVKNEDLGGKWLQRASDHDVILWTFFGLECNDEEFLV